MYYKRSISFRLINDKRKAGDSKIVIRATWCGNRLEFATPHSIPVSQWDSRKQRAKGKANSNGVAVHLINSDLDTLQGLMQDAFNRYEFIDQRPPTKEELRELYNDLAGRTDDKQKLVDKAFSTVAEVYEQYLQATQKGREYGTQQKYITLGNHLKTFCGDMELDDFTSKTMQQLQDYFTDTANLRAASVQRLMNRCKTFLRWAVANDYYRGNAHKTYKVSVKGADIKEVIVLSRDELQQLVACDLPAEKIYLDRVRDLLLFSCFTGLRYSDVQQLTKAHIKRGVISVITKKTTDPLTIELNHTAQQIVDKYSDAYPTKLLPTISNQRFNDYLKELGELAGLDEPTLITYYDGNGRHQEIKPKFELMTSHIGRRTFITNALQLGVPLPTIMAWTGHKDLKAMKPYIKLVESYKRREIAKLDLLLK